MALPGASFGGRLTPQEGPLERGRRDCSAPAQRWARVRSIAEAALALPPEVRQAVILGACGDDAELCADVEAQVDACERAADSVSFLSEPAAAFAALLFSEESAGGRLENAEVSQQAVTESRFGVEATLRATLAGRYDVERELGRGGMATVYLAVDRKHERRVAIKVLDPDLGAAMSPARFLREIRLTASLTHPHILPLHESGEASGLLYYVMPFVDGETLRERLARERLMPHEAALRLVREVASALAYAHRRGVVHRDIKPANILLGDGHAVVADFGIARAVHQAREPKDATDCAVDNSTGMLTEAGTVTGTPAYMAPEQARGDASIDHRADLYALGVVAYEALAGEHPFGRRSPRALIAAHRSEAPPPIAERRADIPPALAAVVMQLLAKDPADRPQSAEEVLRALHDGPAVRADPPPASVRPEQSVANVRRRGATAVIAVLALVVGFGGYTARRNSVSRIAPAATRQVAVATERRSIAILPFENTSGDPADESFSDGLTDELIGALGKVEGLRVAGRTSAFAVKGKRLGVRAVAETLGVSTIVEGSWRRSGSRLRVGAQLVRAADGAVLWSETYDRKMSDVFAVQEEIARAIVGALRVRLGARGEHERLVARATSDLAAYELYVKGRYVFETRSGRDGILRAVGYFEQAIARDPAYAQAHSGLADAYTRLAVFGYAPPRETYAKAMASARRALALDSTLAEAHGSLGHALFVSEFERTDAERELRRAIALDPSYSRARAWLGLYLSNQGRVAEALAHLDTAQTVDPLSLIAGALRGRVYVRDGRADDAIRTLMQVLELDPQLDLAYQQLGHAYLQKNMNAEAIAAFRRAAAASGPRDSAQLAYAYAVTGQRGEAEQIVRALVDPARRGGGALPYHIAMAYAGLGDRDAAFRWLDRGYAERAAFMDGVEVEPGFARLHSDPRWRLLLRRRLPAS